MTKAWKKLGQWPWPRSVHADLIDRLSAARPAGILFDVIFSEPGEAADDQRLADAVCKAGNVLLPTASSDAPDEQLLPLLKCAKGMGQINVEADNDGVVRSLYMREGPPGNTLAQLAWLAYTLTGQTSPMPGLAREPDGQHWHREHAARVPYTAQGHFPQRVLRQRITGRGTA